MNPRHEAKMKLPYHRNLDLLIVTAFGLCLIAFGSSVSFYGESQIHLPLQEASSKTYVHLEFRTYQPYGLLLLAVGNTDFLSVELYSGIIEVRVDLGSGIVILQSSQGLRLDDLQWHSVEVSQNEANISLNVDNVTQISRLSPGRFFELNIHHGIFLGSTGSYQKFTVRTFRNFRGCMRNLVYNSWDIIKIAKAASGADKLEVSWDCDKQFRTSSSQPIHFKTDTAFVAFPYLRIRSEGALSFDLKTRHNNGIIFYNSGRKSSKDFLAFELVSGYSKLSFNRGNGVIVVTTNTSISDGKFHQIDLFLSSSSAEVTIDGIRTTSRFSGRYNYYLDLGGHLYMGGLGQQVRAHAIQQGIVSVQGDNAMKGSLIGCLQNIIVNDRHYSFRDIQISRSIQPGCQLEPQCKNSEACKPGHQCQVIKNVETCVCMKGQCSSNDTVENIPLNGDDVLVVQTLKVVEGGSSVITSNIIDVIFDYHKFRIRESAVHFHLKVFPKHGTIEIGRGRRKNDGIFTLLDIMTSAISYIHDGSESLKDDATLEMEIRSNNGQLPLKLRQNHEFLLPIEITQRNDAPHVILGNGGHFKVVQNAKIRVNSSVFVAEDPDNDSSELIYSVTYQGAGNGYFAKSGRRLTKFTQAEMDDGLIFFVHRGSSVQYVRLQISDKQRVGNYVDLKVRAVKFELTVVKNTGLILPAGTDMVISGFNLTSSGSAFVEDTDIHYHIKQPPNSGMLQYLQRNQSCKAEDGCEEWKTVETFNQQQINRGKLRYKHINDGTDAVDSFKFVVEAKGQSTSGMVFDIIIIELSLTIKQNNMLYLNKSEYVAVTNATILVTSNSPDILSEDILMTVVRPPSQGLLFLFDHPDSLLDFENTPPLRTDSSFTQKNIDEHRLYFKLRKAVFRDISDYVDLRLSSRDISPIIFRLSIQYIPEDSKIKLTNNGLKNVIEGGQMAIERDDLYLQTHEFKDFQFFVVKLPGYGKLLEIDPRSSAVIKENISDFSTRDIREGRVIYEHDDTEHDHDAFEFRAIPIVSSSSTNNNDVIEFNGKFEITVAMRNDNPPVRVVDKVFHVITNSERLITVDDLYFTDPDIDYNTDQLQYSRGAISNGDILNVTNRSSAKQFTQKDIIDKKLLFHHSGTLHGRIAIWVTDGQFYSTGLLEIQASDPYIKVVNNTGLQVTRGSITVLSTYNLSIETNQNVSNSEIKVVIVQEPFNGQIKIDDSPETQFTYKDLVDGKVTYEHTGSKIADDFIEFAFVTGAVKVQAEFIISMLLGKDYMPKLVHNKVLEVREKHTVIITANYLLVEHDLTLPENIIYHITTPPHNGRLIVDGPSRQSSTSTEFTQDDINNGKIRYRHQKEETLTDVVKFDVSNGASALSDLQFTIDIIPDDLPLILKNVSVKEGGKVKLTKEYLRVDGEYFSKIDFVFNVLSSPKHGWLESIQDKTLTLSSFSSQDLELGKIFYLHDNSETNSDNMTIRAVWPINQKRSKIKTLNITVMPVNDQSPKLVSSTTVYVWQGTFTTMSPSMLKAEDLDSDARNITFRVTSPSNGHFAIEGSNNVEIDSFTQHQINTGQIVFVHEGPLNGQFSIEIVDGDFRSKLQTIQVVAKSLKLTLRKNKVLKVFPKTLHLLTESNLYTTVNTPFQANPIVYKVLRKPRRGRIVTVMHNNNLEISSFTQKELKQGSVYYHHGEYINAWSDKDSFMFSVSTLYANTIEDMFYINISYSNIDREIEEQFMVMKGLNVDEGGQTTVTPSYLDITPYFESLIKIGRRVTIEYVVNTVPQHGVIQLNGVNMVAGSVFLQKNINEYTVKYMHDDSDSTNDSIVFSLNITDKTQATVITNYPFRINITIRPINDEPFKLVTRNPGIDVVRGTSVTIMRNHLLTVDNDTTPDQILYEIIYGPKNGLLSLKPNINVRITKFTQQDIDNGLLFFQHDDRKHNGSFHFRVSDGKFRPYYKTFIITAVDIRLILTVHKTIEIMQSESSVYISSSNLNISTNGVRDMVWYTVTDKPRYGHILLDGKPAGQFRQVDIDNLKVNYFQTDMRSGSDMFRCEITIANSDVKIKSKPVNIVVKPLVDQHPIDAPVDSVIAISQFNLDASELEDITGDIPLYTISRKPSYGSIVKNRRGKRQTNDLDGKRIVNVFTHEDVIYLKIFYEVNLSAIIESVNITDSFHYVLSASNVQPAKGVFHINLLPPELITSSTVQDNTTAYTAVTASGVVRPNISDDISYIVWILIGLAVLFIVVIILLVVVIRRKRRRKEYEMQKEKHPRLLPQISNPLLISSPHLQRDDQITLSSEGQPMLDNSESCVHGIPVVSIKDAQSDININKPVVPPRSPDTNQTEVSKTIPTCKVTPLVDNQLEEDHNSQSDDTEFSVNLFNDLSLIDPEFLDLCNTATPVLKDKKYWV